MLLVDDLAAGGTKNLRHTPRGLVTLHSVPTAFKCSGYTMGHAWVTEDGKRSRFWYISFQGAMKAKGSLRKMQRLTRVFAAHIYKVWM